MYLVAVHIHIYLNIVLYFTSPLVHVYYIYFYKVLNHKHVIYVQTSIVTMLSAYSLEHLNPRIINNKK